MATKRAMLKLRRALRHKARRAERLNAWKRGYAIERIKKHQAFKAMAATLALVKAKLLAAKKEARKAQQ